MAYYPENYGLDFLHEDEKAECGMVAHIAEEGKILEGYSGNAYIFKSYGNAEFWLQVQKNEDEEYSVVGLDSHCGGACVWDMVYTGVDLTPKDMIRMKRVLMLQRADGSGGIVPVELITADVLPSLMKGDRVRIQVAALPARIEYYADQEAYEAAQPGNEDGEKWLVGEGALFPLNFLINHDVDTYEEDKDCSSDVYVHFCATVKKLYHGTFGITEEKLNTFIRCIADTEYGELEFDHTYEQVPEELRENIRVGAVISGVCLVSGDAAIFEYENGMVRDPENDLRLLRYSMTEGDTDRLRSVLAFNVTFHSEASSREYRGEDKIIEWIDLVKSYQKDNYTSHLATITSSDETREYPSGTRCIALLQDEEEPFNLLVFIKVDAAGKIERIDVNTETGYEYAVDEPVPAKGDDD